MRREDPPTWLSPEAQRNWDKTDLTFEFCIKLFAQIEAAKREKIPPETARQWFIEFIRRGWTKKMLQDRYDALMTTKIYGIEKLEIADWINAIQVYAIDEVNLMIKDRINNLIQQGRLLKDKKPECNYTEAEKKKILLYEAEQIKQNNIREQYEANEDWLKQERMRIKKEIFFHE